MWFCATNLPLSLNYLTSKKFILKWCKSDACFQMKQDYVVAELNLTLMVVPQVDKLVRAWLSLRSDKLVQALLDWTSSLLVSVFRSWVLLCRCTKLRLEIKKTNMQNLSIFLARLGAYLSEKRLQLDAYLDENKSDIHPWWLIYMVAWKNNI